MTTLLRIDASARANRSITRRLSGLFFEAWQRRRPQDRIIARDVGLSPPPAVSESWMAAPGTDPSRRTPEMQKMLATSDGLIDELIAADILVVGTPMYNYGMPSALKAWFDMVIRVNRTFTFDASNKERPISAVLSGKTLVVLSSRGEFGFAEGGVRSHMNQLDPHIRTCGFYLGIADSHTIAAEYEEFQDDRWQRSLADAEAATLDLVEQLAAREARHNH